MASSDPSSLPPKPVMTSTELVSFVHSVLDADEEHQAKLATATPGELPTGSTLDLSHKGICELPVEVIVLIKDKVERLALSHNPRIALPTEIALCDRLRYLNLRWNKLKHFPDAVLSLSKLEILDISKNAIDAIPEDIKKMTNLKFLAVARNQIKRLPLALGDMNLVKLKFDENPIEFPPPEVLTPSPEASAAMIGSEKDKDMCQQVKRFMKAAALNALRERLKSTSEEELSEGNVETPRPPRRGITGRFPVRPSISGIETMPNVKSDSPQDYAPQVALRSHVRGVSSTYLPPTKRPGVTPLLTSGIDNSRSRSETVATSANIRNRRQGYVPRKNSGLNSLTEMSSQLSARSGQSLALTPPHSRAPSVSSTYTGHLAAGSGGESSSGAVSPSDGPTSRAILTRKLASLTESRNSTMPIANSIRAAKRVLFMLFYVYRPIADIVQQLRSGTPRRTGLERQLFSANAQVEELDRLIHRANNIVEDNGEIDGFMLRSIMRTAVGALRMYGSAVKELNRNRQQAVKHVDALHVRCVINTGYGTIIEAGNVCRILGFQPNSSYSRDTIRASQAWSSRTVTPTQPKSATMSSSNRRREATILPNAGNTTNPRGMAPPVPLNSGSRSNTMTSATVATPRYNDLFVSTATPGVVSSRSNTLRNVTDENERDDPVEHAYLKVKLCSDMAGKLLAQTRVELTARKTHADNSGHSSASQSYSEAITKCDCALKMSKNMSSKLPTVRAGDPARTMKELSQITESFGKEWTSFVTKIATLAKQGIDVGLMRRSLRPLQHAVKDANKAVSMQVPQAKPPPSASLHGHFTSSLDTALAQSAGYIPSVPATPLGAALGAAVQATVPPTPVMPTMPHNTTEYFAPPTSRRITPDGVASPPSYPRR